MHIKIFSSAKSCNFPLIFILLICPILSLISTNYLLTWANVQMIIITQPPNGYPTIKYFGPGEKGEGDKYAGGRDVAALETFMNNKLAAAGSDHDEL